MTATGTQPKALNLSITCVLLAAGEGKRMKSSRSKVLFTIAGRPLFVYPLLAAERIGVGKAVVVASPTNRAVIEQALTTRQWTIAVETCVQERQLGTGDAVAAALGSIGTDWALILYGDGPLILDSDLLALGEAVERDGSDLSLLTCELDDPTGYGRILKKDGRVVGIREQRDLRGPDEEGNRLVNPGIYLVRTRLLREALASLKPNNDQGEYYLTDIVAFAAERGTVSEVAGDDSALSGINDRAQLFEVEEKMMARIRDRHARAGVTIRGDARIDDTVSIEADAEIRAGASLRGNTSVGTGTLVDVGCVVSDSEVASDCVLKPYSVISESRIEQGVHIGPFAHLRPGTVLESASRIGNFVETKNTRVGTGAKANHLAYLGDADVGSESNIGAGTIVCNYDGVNKWRTTIGKGAFIGSDSQLIAPVVIGDGAYVGTGSTITNDVPPDALAIARARQVNKPDYAHGLRQRLNETKARKKKNG